MTFNLPSFSVDRLMGERPMGHHGAHGTADMGYTRPTEEGLVHHADDLRESKREIWPKVCVNLSITDCIKDTSLGF